MNVEIITIGDELLIGQVIDSNSVWMAQQLGNDGFRVVRKTAVGDDAKDITDAIDKAFEKVDIVLLTGGIGPTKDDITKRTLCEYFGSELYFSEDVYANIETLFTRNGRIMNELTRDQAYVPDNCTIIQNETGTAPCMWFDYKDKVLISMPGVPYEMKWLMSTHIIPLLKQHFFRDTYICHYTAWVSGYSESVLAMELKQFEEELPSFVSLAYLPQPGIIRLRLSAYTNQQEKAEKTIEELKNKLHEIVGDYIITEGNKGLEEQLGKELAKKGLLMGTAESCTGGRIASMITAWPGSSSHYAGTIVSYSNDVKANVLKVSAADIEKYGAVSQPVVEQMVKGAINVLSCDCAVATSGIAGPDGGTPDKPVGTIWIAAAVKDQVVSECFHFGTIREQNIIRASNTALLMLLKMIRGGS